VAFYGLPVRTAINYPGCIACFGRPVMKKVLIALGVILALVILAVIIIPFLIPVEKYKEEIAAQVKSSTGRDFVIAGPLSLSLFPNIALSAEDVRFANWPASKEPQMATLKEL